MKESNKLQKHLISRPKTKEKFEGKSVAIVGSAPSVLENEPGFIDSHDIVVRINNYKLTPNTGHRTDVFYSFFGSSVRKDPEVLQGDGVWLCMAKCPDSKPIYSRWHDARGKLGTDYRYIYKLRKDFWFCDTYVTSNDRFIEYFNLLDKHVPTTGFQAILEISDFNCKSIYLTGFDFFRSGIHNVDELWKQGNPKDPIGHKPLKELEWVRENKEKFTFDERLAFLL